MKTAYLDCFAGISGNMCLGALIDAGADPGLVSRDAAKVVKDFKLKAQKSESRHLGGVHVKVEYSPKRQHERHLADIEKLIKKSGLPASVVERSLAVFRTLAEAEAKVHRISPEKVHFHEVGAVDAIVDVVGTVSALHRLGVERVICSPLPLARGEVRCAHGILPLPAPAVVELLKGVPVEGAPPGYELVTPTGAALAVTLASSFGPLPPLTLEKSGSGLGDHKLPDRPNLMRVLIGETAGQAETLIQFEAGIDDMSPEWFEPLLARLTEAGALEVMFVPAQMKKNRPGSLVRVLAPHAARERILAAFFTHSTTLGVREYQVGRASLPRAFTEVETGHGRVRVKLALRPGGRQTAHFEYDDLKALSARAGVSIGEIEREAAKALSPRGGKRRG